MSSCETRVRERPALNVFHVLEEEYVALHGELPHIPGKGWDVTPDQVLDASAIGRPGRRRGGKCPRPPRSHDT